MAVEFQLAAQSFGSLTHPDQAEVPVHGREYVLRLESTAGVGDGEMQLLRFNIQPQRNSAGMGVLQDIGDGFLGNSQYVVGDILRKTSGITAGIDIYIDSRS